MRRLTGTYFFQVLKKVSLFPESKLFIILFFYIHEYVIVVLLRRVGLLLHYLTLEGLNCVGEISFYQKFVDCVMQSFEDKIVFII